MHTVHAGLIEYSPSLAGSNSQHCDLASHFYQFESALNYLDNWILIIG
jgi:hypothetical protein